MYSFQLIVEVSCPEAIVVNANNKKEYKNTIPEYFLN
jgi:hypothetical protein